MAATRNLAHDKLSRLVGTPACPAIVDVRTAAEAAALPASIPGSARRDGDAVAAWAAELAGQSAVIVCRDCAAASPAAAAWLRAAGVAAETLEGGILAWTGAGLPLVPEASLPPRDGLGRTFWVTRARPKVDRIACPWLIRRFVDRSAVFLFVAPSEIAATAARLGATPFDVDGVHWSHRGEHCTFDAMVEGFGLAGFAALNHLALIVRGADTARPDLAPQCAGLLAVSLGLSRMHADDHRQLEAGMPLYDAFYRWCRDAVDETHDWVSHRPRARARSRT